MKVVKNSLTSRDVNELPVLSVTSNILTSFGEVVVTSDDQIFMTEGSGVE